MTFRLTFKTPDVFDQIDEGGIEHSKGCEGSPEDILNDGNGPYCSWCGESVDNTAKEFAKKFLKHEEYITIEFDTNKDTAEVLRTL